MNILIDTLTGLCGVAQSETSSIIEIPLRDQSAQLSSLLAQSLSGLSAQEELILRVVVGPGSFTAIKSGLAAAQAARLGRGLKSTTKLWGVDRLGAIAMLCGVNAAVDGARGRAFVGADHQIHDVELDQLDSWGTLGCYSDDEAVRSAMGEKARPVDAREVAQLMLTTGSEEILCAPEPVYARAPEITVSDWRSKMLGLAHG